jgi:sulfur carrier protein
MRVRVNGDPHELPDDATVTALVEQLALKPERIAVERNRLVVRRAAWAETVLVDGDDIEVLTFVGGG